jgi:predicted HNH restriction endonuclease
MAQEKKDKTFKQKSTWTKVQSITAVEWLEDALPTNTIVKYREQIDKAKAIEKEQIQEAFIEGGVQYISNIGDDIPPKAEDYYNKTYKTSKP